MKTPRLLNDTTPDPTKRLRDALYTQTWCARDDDLLTLAETLEWEERITAAETIGELVEVCYALTDALWSARNLQ